jgi:hypothetical protein
MRLMTKFTLLLAATVPLMSCGGGGGGGTAPVAMRDATIGINAANGALVSQALSGVPVFFPEGVTALGTVEPTTLTVTNTGEGTPTFSIDFGIFVATGELGFGSCKFNIKKTEIKADTPTVEVNAETGELLLGTPQPGVTVLSIPARFLSSQYIPPFVRLTLPVATGRAMTMVRGPRNYDGRILAAAPITDPTALEIEPCAFTLATAGRLADGTLQNIEVSVTLGSTRSPPAKTTITIEPNGDILITQPNGRTQRISGVPTGLITGLS